MCGIAGYIGISKNEDITRRIMAEVLEKLEKRGTDSTGLWGTESKNDGKVLYHKEPTKSSEFVKSETWKSYMTHPEPINLLICHARAASKGVGTPSNNKNNHPFITSSHNVGLVHNGKVETEEYEGLIKKFEVESQCDSEILLRVFENGENYSDEELASLSEFDYPHRIAGIKDIYSLVNDGAFAVAVGEKVPNDDERILWLFRNYQRPIWLVDLRDWLGQMFFVSAPEIWEEAIKGIAFSAVNGLKRTYHMWEIPVENIYQFNIKDGDLRFQRHKVVKDTKYSDFNYTGKRLAVPTSEVKSDLVPLKKSSPPIFNKNYVETEHTVSTDVSFRNRADEEDTIDISSDENSNSTIEALLKSVEELDNIDPEGDFELSLSKTIELLESLIEKYVNAVDTSSLLSKEHDPMVDKLSKVVSILEKIVETV